MKINRQELLGALKLVEPGLGSDDSNQSNCFIFTEDGRVCTYNADIAVSVPVAVDFTGAVPKKLMEMISKVKAEEIGFALSKGEDGGMELRLAASKAKVGLRLDPQILLPLDELGRPDLWEPLPDNFNAAVKFSLFSAGRDHNKPALTYIHVLEDCLETCDNNRATRYFFDQAVVMRPIMIPAAAGKQLIGYKCDEFAMTTGWLHFRNASDVTFSCRTTYEEYPDLDRFLSCTGEQSTFPDGMIDMLERASIMSDGDKVNVYLNGKDLTISGEGSAGWYEESAKVTYSGPEVEFDISPFLLSDMLKLNASITIAAGRLLFEAEAFSHIVKTYPPKGAK